MPSRQLHLLHVFVLALSSQKVLSGSCRAGRLRFMGKYIDHRLVARPEPHNTFSDDSTPQKRGLCNRLWACLQVTECHSLAATWTSTRTTAKSSQAVTDSQTPRRR